MVMRRSGSGVQALRKGPWMPEEDEVLFEHVRKNGAGNWSLIPLQGLLPRTGKSCRLRWVNKLRPGLKKGRKFTPEEEARILDLQSKFGNKWATIAKFFPGRTDNDVKNFWSIHRKRLARAAQRSRGSPAVSTSNQAVNPDTKAVTVDTLQELHALEMEAQGSNSKCKSTSTTSSATADPQPDVNQILIKPNPDQVPQTSTLDAIFDLSPLPEIHLLQTAPEPKHVNLMQHQNGQVFLYEQTVHSMNLGRAQCIGPNQQALVPAQCIDPNQQALVPAQCIDPNQQALVPAQCIIPNQQSLGPAQCIGPNLMQGRKGQFYQGETEVCSTNVSLGQGIGPNLMQGRNGPLFQGEPEVGSMNLGPAQCKDPTHSQSLAPTQSIGPNLMQGQNGQSFQDEPEVGSTNLGPAECISNFHSFLQRQDEFFDFGLEPQLMDTLFPPQTNDSDNLEQLLNSFESQPYIKYTPEAN